jgi:biopolymer transport protein ExbD
MAQAGTSSFGPARRASDTLPLSEINTTPLIDVMLVLLIMFIITVPTQSHQAEMNLPNGPLPIREIYPVRNDLALSADGQLSWNGKPMSDAQLVATLGAVAGYAEQPEVHFRPDAATRYQRVDEVLGMAARSGAERFGFAGNERYDKVF